MRHIKRFEPSTLLAERYLILKCIGGSDKGGVYLAHDKQAGDALRAVKERIGLFDDESQRKKALEDFEREVQMLANLKHPSIPTLYDHFISEGHHYLVMQYISGGNLASRLREANGGQLDERTVTEWAIQICDVLNYLHSIKPTIIHRDVKPSNLMLDEHDRIVMIGFDTARFVLPTQKVFTIVGTMGYAAPELFAGRVAPCSDIYSLGATMFHLLTGHDPQNNPLLVFDFNRNPRPSQINPVLSTGIEEIICKAVKNGPSNRFASTIEMKKALEEHLRQLERSFG